MSTVDYGDGMTIGYATGFDAGYAVGWADKTDEITAAWTGIVPVFAQPRQAELARERVVDHTPCPAACRRCSRCIHSLAYWARGGRDYEGAAR